MMVFWSRQRRQHMRDQRDVMGLQEFRQLVQATEHCNITVKIDRFLRGFRQIPQKGAGFSAFVNSVAVNLAAYQPM